MTGSSGHSTRFLPGVRKPVLGVVHLLPLPGSEGYRGDGLAPILDRAVDEARVLAAGGVDAILFQNTGDLPAGADGGPETIACMSVIGAALRREVNCPLGVNILANGASSAVAVAQAVGAAFVRIKVYVGAVMTAEGILTGAARETLAFRRRIQAEEIAIVADVYDRTSAPVGTMPITVAADLAARHGHADALVVAGYSVEDSLARIAEIKGAVPETPVLAGGGTTAANVGKFLESCDGVIVGSSVKDTGQFVGRVDPSRLAAYMEAVEAARART
ncbi:MAG TPA: BtpA/SgcQ family protein [Ardenticatenaceae bacterium]|nr:BtpA/SgcQ family protein [Ardenticatenaceae bacterium]